MQCDKWITESNWLTGKRQRRCGREAQHLDIHKRNLCTRHYKQWLKKVNKGLLTALGEIKQIN